MSQYLNYVIIKETAEDPYTKTKISQVKTRKQPRSEVRKKTKDLFGKCECKSEGAEKCVDREDYKCSNVKMLLECNSTNCSFGGNCGNQWTKLKHFRTDCCSVLQGNCGRGLLAFNEIPENSIIGEYLGEITQNKNSHYTIDLKDKKNAVDASEKGNLLRFINHTCGTPNCEFVVRLFDCGE